MEEAFGGSGFGGMANLKKQRSPAFRRPRLDFRFVAEASDRPSPSFDNASNLSADGSLKNIRKEDRKLGRADAFCSGGLSGKAGSDLRSSCEGILAPATSKSSCKARESPKMQPRSPETNIGKMSDNYHLDKSVDSHERSAEYKQRKVRLKLAGVTQMEHRKSENGKSVASQHQQRFQQVVHWDDGHSASRKGHSMPRVKQKDFGGNFPHGPKEDLKLIVADEGQSKKKIVKSNVMGTSEPTPKRVPKKRTIESASGATDQSDDISYPKSVKNPKLEKVDGITYEDDGKDSLKPKRISKGSKSKETGYDVDEDYVSQSTKNSKRRSRVNKVSDGVNYAEEIEPDSDVGPDAKKKKQGDSDTSNDTRPEPLTTRQRALQSSKEGRSSASSIEFPNGLPPAPPRKQKEKLSEDALQAKKAEAAQRRKMQVEKANRELEAAAIRKILGQDSKKKNKEEEKLKILDEKAKAANALTLAPGTVRWTMGPTGTVVTFADDVGLPSILDSKPRSYPPPREKCAAPSCPNAYKYRDSKSNLPLCSLQCYRAIQEHSQTVLTC